MAVYEFFCPTCRVQFEERRPMADADLPARCERGHRADRLISTFALVRTGGGSEAAPQNASAGTCCAGGACRCRAG